MSQTRPNVTGSKTLTYTGTGPGGATIGRGLVKKTSQVSLQPASAALEDVKGKVLLQGNVVKSVVSHELTNTGILEFKGKTSSTSSNPQSTVVKPLKKKDDAIGDITVAGDATKCVVTVKMTTNGISFDDDDD